MLRPSDQPHYSPVGEFGKGKIALVTGSTGAIGPALVRALTRGGYAVRALCRREPERGLFPGGTSIVTGQLDDLPGMEAAAEGVDVVFHLASRLHINDPGPEQLDEYKRVNVGGTGCVVQASRNQRVRRLIFASTITVYGPSRNGVVFDENSATRPDSYYAETKLEAENIVLGEVPGVVLRLAAVYGPRMKGNYARLAGAIKRRRFVPIGRGTNLRTLVFLTDAVEAALLAAQHPSAEGQIYNVTDGEIHQLRNILDAAYAAVGRRTPPFHVPLPALKLAAGVVQSLAKSTGIKSPITTSALAKLEEDVAVRGDKLQSQLAFIPRYNLREGWAETMRLGVN